MKKYRTKRARKEALSAFIFVAPFLLGVSIFNVYAFLKNIVVSFTNKKSFGEASFIGWSNYIKLLGDEKFYQALINTLKYIVICVPVIIVLAMLIAMALNMKIKGIGIYRTLIYLPIITLPTAVGLVWKWLFNNQFGLINAFLGKIGIQGPSWLSDSKVSLIAVSIVLIWSSIGTAVIILLAGLQGIEKTYYEAAQIDGANEIQKFLNITFPLLSPTTFMLVVTEIIGFFQVFDMIFLMISPTSSGMNGARSIVMLFYEEAFTKFNKGYGAAMANVLFLIILVITVIQMKLQKKWVFYE
ncbi:MAG: sugar ABC transporter permease [Eubacteriales bacterium]|nr:sugar ABC transporter permease [Eubacteriales bacterium]